MIVPRLLLALAAVVLVACGGNDASASDCDRIAGVREGLCLIPQDERRQAPDDVLPVLGDDDAELSIADHRGQVVVLNFWASWCGPCRVEQPDLNDAHDALPADEVAFLGVNIEESRQSNGIAHEREFDIPYPSMYDPGNDLAAGFGDVGPRVPPSTLFLDGEGRVAARVLGTVGTSEVIGLADAIASEG